MLSLKGISNKKDQSRILKVLIFTMMAAPLFFASSLFAPMSAPAVPKTDDELKFNLSPQDIKEFNLNEKEAAELQQFFDALNNLSTDEKQKLKEDIEETEAEMRSKKLDPTNFDDLVKFMEEKEKESKGLPSSEPITPPFEEKAPAVEKKPIIQVSSPKNTLSLLREIERKLESILVKVKTREVLEKRLSTLSQELAEFLYFIKIVQAPDLVLLLASKEFEGLRKNLETLHKALASSEPSIIARHKTGDMDDPYEVLSVNYDASPEQITQAYNKLKQTQSPEAVEKTLKDLPEKDRKKTVKKARLTWTFIQNAYETLIDENQRAMARKELKNKIDQEAQRDRSSRAAFDKAFNALTTAFYPQAVLKDIKGLLEKHKPQELELAKKALEAEKKVAERAKQPVRIETTPIRQTAQEEPYAAFWQKMTQESYMRPLYPIAPSAPAAPLESGGAKESGAQKDKETGKGQKKAAGKKEKKEEKKGKEKEDKKGKEKVALKEIPKFTAIDELEKLLKEAKPTLEVVTKPKRGIPTRAIPSQDDTENREDKSVTDDGTLPKTQPVKFETIGAHLAQDLRKPVVRAAPGPDESAQQTKLYYEENRLADITKTLKKIAPGKEKIDPAVCKTWEEKIMKPYGKLLKGWYDSFYVPLSHQQVGKRDRSKSILYKLDTPEPTDTDIFKKDDDKKDAKKPKDTDKKKGKDTKKSTDDTILGPQLNLAEVRDTLKAMHAYVENIQKACSGATKTVTKKQDKKDEDKENKEPQDTDDSNDQE